MATTFFTYRSLLRCCWLAYLAGLDVLQVWLADLHVGVAAGHWAHVRAPGVSATRRYNQLTNCCWSALVLMRIRIRIQRFKVNKDPVPIPIPDPGVRMTKNLKKKVTIAIYFYLRLHKGRTSNSRLIQPSKKRTSSWSSTTYFQIYSLLVGNFCLPSAVSGFSQSKSMRIHTDPDPQHWIKQRGPPSQCCNYCKT